MFKKKKMVTNNIIPKVFLLVYIDKNKLLDVNSILFDGYSDFSEEIFEFENSKHKNNKNNATTNIGFSIFKISGDMDMQNANENRNKKTTTLKRIQTTSSLLSNTITILKEKKYLKAENLKVGDFIEICGTFKNNSISDLLEQTQEMLNFANLALKLTQNSNSKEIVNTKDMIPKIKNIIKKKDDKLRELVYVKDDCIYVIHLMIDNIYMATIEDIYNHSLYFFGQVKEITDDYNFFADTQISKFNKEIVKSFTNAIKQILDNENYKLDFEVLQSSEGKKL